MIKLTIEELNRLDIDAYHRVKKRPIRVILDNIRSQHNIGSIFRTADAFRIEGIDLCGICCCPPDKEIHKTALGAEEAVSWTYYKNTEEAAAELKKKGYTIWGIEQAHNSITLQNAIKKSPPKHLAVILGHEVFGIQEGVLTLCDDIIEIPQYGTKHSLNVSVTAGIILYEISSQYPILP